MPSCDLCGKEEFSLFKVSIEGVTMSVCKGCSTYGKILQAPQAPQRKRPSYHRPQPVQEEKEEVVVSNFAALIKKKREALGMNQKEFAIKVNEKESRIHSIESGSLKPTLRFAKKLQRTLHIRLVEEEKSEAFVQERKSKAEGFTLGDFIKIKKK